MSALKQDVGIKSGSYPGVPWLHPIFSFRTSGFQGADGSWLEIAIEANGAMMEPEAVAVRFWGNIELGAVVDGLEDLVNGLRKALRSGSRRRGLGAVTPPVLDVGIKLGSYPSPPPHHPIFSFRTTGFEDGDGSWLDLTIEANGATMKPEAVAVRFWGDIELGAVVHGLDELACGLREALRSRPQDLPNRSQRGDNA